MFAFFLVNWEQSFFDVSADVIEFLDVAPFSDFFIVQAFGHYGVKSPSEEPLLVGECWS